MPVGLRGPPTSRRGCGGSPPTHGRRTAGRATHRGRRRHARTVASSTSPLASRSSTAAARTGTAATQPSTTRQAPSDTDAAALAMYVPWAPSVTPAMPSPCRFPPAGMLMRVSRSPSPTAVSNTPTKKSLAATVRSPRGAADGHRRAERHEQRREVVRRIVDADVAAEGPAVSHLDVGHRRGDLGEDRPRDLHLGGADERRSVAMAPISSVDRRRRRSCGARRDPRGRRGRRARRPAAFITLTSVWPPASARAPSCSERRATASSTVAGRA